MWSPWLRVALATLCATAARRLSKSKVGGRESSAVLRVMQGVIGVHAASRLLVSRASLQDRLFSPGWIGAVTSTLLVGSGAPFSPKWVRAACYRGLRYVLMVVSPGMVWKALVETENPGEDSDPCALMAIVLALMLGRSRNVKAAGVILVMLTGGEALEDYALRRAGDGMRQLIRSMRMNDKQVRRRDNTFAEVSELRKGDVIKLCEGDMVPADGIMTSSSSSMVICNESIITGEDASVRRVVGDMIYSGTLIVKGPCELSLRRSADESMTGLISQELQAALADRRQSPLERSCAQVASALTPIAVAIATTSYMIRALNATNVSSVNNAVIRQALRRRWEVVLSVLMAATPCPLSIGVPVAFLSARSTVTKEGITLKSGGALEQLAKATCVVLDKTGTVTTGKMDLTDCTLLVPKADPSCRNCCISLKADEEKAVILECLAAVELHSGSVHAVAQALTRRFHVSENPEGFCVLQTEIHPGQGVSASVQLGEKLSRALEVEAGGEEALAISVVIGSQSFVASLAENSLSSLRVHSENEGKFEIFFAFLHVDAGKPLVLGRLNFEDPLRCDAVSFVSSLKQKFGLRVILASGDSSPALYKAAQALALHDFSLNLSGEKVPSWCHCLPHGKAELIKRLKGQGERVIMIGDGLNDAAALAVAHVAIAVGSNDLVASVSDVIIGGGASELLKVLHLLDYSRATLHIAKRGVFGGMCASSLQMIFAAFGLLSPFTNALLQECVDLTTVLHAVFSPSAFGSTRHH